MDLFVARARAVGADVSRTPAVRELCARLDCLPLALELAAARAVVFSPEQMLQRLGQRLDLLKGGRDADPRQQTLRATIEWSYRLLDEREQDVFSSLSVFPGGCTYDAAETVAGADPDVLQSLLDKSLVRREPGNLEPRYWMLEIIREYASERRAQSAGGAAVQARFDSFAASCAERLGADYLGGRMADAVMVYADERTNIWFAVERARSSPRSSGRLRGRALHPLDMERGIRRRAGDRRVSPRAQER